MFSRRLVRSVAILVFSALLVPVAGLQATQGRHHQPAPASAAQHRHPVIDFLLGLLAGAGVKVDIGPDMDGNG